MGSGGGYDVRLDAILTQDLCPIKSEVGVGAEDPGIYRCHYSNCAWKFETVQEASEHSIRYWHEVPGVSSTLSTSTTTTALSPVSYVSLDEEEELHKGLFDRLDVIEALKSPPSSSGQRMISGFDIKKEEEEDSNDGCLILAEDDVDVDGDDKTATLADKLNDFVNSLDIPGEDNMSPFDPNLDQIEVEILGEVEGSSRKRKQSFTPKSEEKPRMEDVDEEFVFKKPYSPKAWKTSTTARRLISGEMTLEQLIETGFQLLKRPSRKENKVQKEEEQEKSQEDEEEEEGEEQITLKNMLNSSPSLHGVKGMRGMKKRWGQQSSPTNRPTMKVKPRRKEVSAAPKPRPIRPKKSKEVKKEEEAPKDLPVQVKQEFAAIYYSYEFILQHGLRNRDKFLATDDYERPFHCPVPDCLKKYKNANGLKYHAQFGHCPPECFLCPKCGKKYTCRAGLVCHLKSHQRRYGKGPHHEEGLVCINVG